MDDVALNKAAIIERCIKRIRDEYCNDFINLHNNQTRQDSIVLNLQRICEAAIDLAMHEVRKHRLGVPQESREAFSLLLNGRLLEEKLAKSMMSMVGFRNVAIHNYQELNLDIVQKIIEKHLDDFLDFTRAILKREAE